MRFSLKGFLPGLVLTAFFASSSYAVVCPVWVKIGADVDKGIKINLPATQSLVKPGPFPAQISLVSTEQTNLAQVLPVSLRTAIVQKGFRGSPVPSTYLLELSANSNRYVDADALHYAVFAKLSQCASPDSCSQIWNSSMAARGSGDGFDPSPALPSPASPGLTIVSDEDLFAAWTKVISEQLPKLQNCGAN